MEWVLNSLKKRNTRGNLVGIAVVRLNDGAKVDGFALRHTYFRFGKAL
jgi:hypothetical protein